MSTKMEEEVKRWTAKRKTALVLEVIQGKTTVAEASRSFDIAPSEIEEWVDDAKWGMENALRTKPLEIKEQYERQIKDLQEAYGEAMLEPPPLCQTSCRLLRTKNPGGGDEGNQWHVTDNHSRIGQSLGWCRLKAQHWSWYPRKLELHQKHYNAGEMTWSPCPPEGRHGLRQRDCRL